MRPCNISKIIFSLILLGNTTLAAAVGSTLFTITPSVTNISLSSNGNSNVMYTLTNNATTNATPSITPGYQSLGNNLTIASNTCNSVLPPQANCTFRILISGANQPNNFTITPRACGFNGFLCSVSNSPVTVTVNQPAAGLATRAYEEVINNDLSTTTLLGININNTEDVISYDLHSTDKINSVAISPDGSTVYAVKINNESGVASVLFFTVTDDSLILTQEVIIPTGPSFYNVSPFNLQMTLTPDGSTLFITKFAAENSLHSNAFVPNENLFRIDLSSDTSVITVIRDPEHILARPSGLVVSPDGKTLYVGTNTNYLVAMPVNAVSINSDNEIVPGSIPEDEHMGLAIDPAGSKLYVGNQSQGSVSILSVNGMQANFEETILNDEYSGASGLAVSPDGATLYVAETNDNNVLAVPLSNPSQPLVQPDVAGAFGLSLSPDGSALYATQADYGANTTTVFNTAIFFSTPSTLVIGGRSLTIGNFIGP